MTASCQAVLHPTKIKILRNPLPTSHNSQYRQLNTNYNDKNSNKNITMKLYLSFLLLTASSLTSTSSAFSFITSSKSTTRTTFAVSSPSQLSAIIYGWDGDDDTEGTSTSSLDYLDTGSEVGFGACTPTGNDLAETFNDDRDRTGSFARLAVAFSPPERGLSIKDIERVEVVCVREGQIELEAILCESGGCVSLSIPIKFPNDCGEEWMTTGCVTRNLDALEGTAETTLKVMSQQAAQQLSSADLEELCQLNDKVEYPSWWVPPECDAHLADDCEAIKRLMNQEDFVKTIAALARDGLQNAGQGYSNYYDVKKARVAAVGPAGMCLRVAVTSVDKVEGFEILDVMYPFGGEPVKTADALRAVVLGAVAAAEEKI
mmetsp:Transcript_23148/g.30663  ORF Transcript_23148/g.30663 Transcript_23148/m.30663 type:complete len:374 (-) Transcript_23148:91-1212(-)